MSFLGMGTMEIFIILLVAFIFLGPERMVDAARTLGKWTGELRRMGSTVQAEMDDLVNVDSPLATRRSRTETTSDSGAMTRPLDQDHPADSSGASNSATSDMDSPVGFRRATAETSQQSHDGEQSARREESA